MTRFTHEQRLTPRHQHKEKRGAARKSLRNPQQICTPRRTLCDPRLGRIGPGDRQVIYVGATFVLVPHHPSDPLDPMDNSKYVRLQLLAAVWGAWVLAGGDCFADERCEWLL